MYYALEEPVFFVGEDDWLLWRPVCARQKRRLAVACFQELRNVFQYWMRVMEAAVAERHQGCWRGMVAILSLYNH